jgi:hypothetical protein
MNQQVVKIFSIFILMLLPAYAVADDLYKSKYAGQEKREIKSLSENDIEELQNGKGWGLAKAAELNGVPGPAHLLAMKDKINLSAEQSRAVADLHNKMKQEAIPLGLELIELERALNDHFANKTITYELLDAILEKIARVKKKLRYVHLATHLKTQDILTSRQIDLYNKLRGYSPDGP